jgi:hypothetical protein
VSDPNTTAANTVPVAPTKPGKSKGLSIFNRVAFIVAALLAVLTIAMLVATAMTTKSAANMRDEAQATREQAGQELAAYWCAQITPENVAKFDELRDLYLGVSETAQNAVDQQCQKKVTITDLVTNNDPNGAFDTTSQCTINASSTKITCTATVTANDTIKKDLASFSSTTVTLQMSMQTTSSKLTSKGHDLGEVATVDVDRSGTGKTQFTVPYDPTWGEYYKVDVKSFFPNE